MIKFILDAMYYQIFIFNRDKFNLEYPNNILIAISVNATDISSVPVASHFVNVYFFGRLHSSLALI